MSRVGTRLLACLFIANVSFAHEEGATVGGRTQLLTTSASAFNAGPLVLKAQGPGMWFASIEAAAIDALTYAYLEGFRTRTSERMRGGTIYREGNRYSYGKPHVAGPLTRHRISYALRSMDVARFMIYPRVGHHRVDRENERPSRVDRRSVNVTDPLHRPLYILHPSLVIREYRGEDHELVEVANLRNPTQEVLNSGNDRSTLSPLLARQ